jgi:hypothetical protein
LIRSNYREIRLALDDFEDRFATAVKLALDTSRISGGDELDPSAETQCPSLDMIASYYEYALSRGERARLETHFSHCARCQGTLAALLHAAPIVDAASEAGGFAVAAARKAAAESAGIRERWFEISPVWRIAGTAAAAAAMLAVVVVASLHVYQGKLAPESEQVAAARVAPPHNRNKVHTFPSTDELALNENKSLAPAATAEPHSATPPAAAAAVGTPMRDVSGASPAASAAAVPPRPTAGEAAPESSNAPAEAALPSQTAAPLAAPANTAENADETAATAAQAAAALGALASTPVPAASPASAAATAGAAATADAAASMEAPGTSAGAPALASKNVGTAVAAAPLAGAVVGSSVDAPSSAAAATATAPPASGAAAQAKPAASPASEAAARAAATATPGTVTQELAVLAPPPPRLERFQKETVTRPPAKTSEIAPNGDFRKSESTGEPEASAGATELSSKAQKRAQLAEKRQAADIVREAKRALRDARLESAAGSRRPDSPAAFQPESAVGGLVPGSAAALPVKRPVAPQPQRALSAAGAAHSAVGHARAAAPSAVPSGAGNAIAMTDRPVASAPAVAKIAPGIPVPPRSILISPADHSVYWSLQNFGLIYRTVDHKTWTPQPTGVQADLLAGMATSNTVCWAVGRKGTILLTTDGMHWEQIKSPTASDVVGITAAGKDVATIFTSGGVNYSTFDGGSNWEKAN